MPDPNVNPDGTKQVVAPTKSAFAPQDVVKKAGPVTPTENKDTGDKEPDHGESVVNGIRGLIRQHAGKEFNQNADKMEKDMEPSSAVQAAGQGVASAPGNSSDY